MDGAKALRERAARLLRAARDIPDHPKAMALLQESLRLIRRAEAMEVGSASAPPETGERPKQPA
jgi:hypothetical protein